MDKAVPSFMTSTSLVCADDSPHVRAYDSDRNEWTHEHLVQQAKASEGKYSGYLF